MTPTKVTRKKIYTDPYSLTIAVPVLNASISSAARERLAAAVSNTKHRPKITEQLSQVPPPNFLTLISFARDSGSGHAISWNTLTDVVYKEAGLTFTKSGGASIALSAKAGKAGLKAELQVSGEKNSKAIVESRSYNNATAAHAKAIGNVATLQEKGAQAQAQKQKQIKLAKALKMLLGKNDAQDLVNRRLFETEGASSKFGFSKVRDFNLFSTEISKHLLHEVYQMKCPFVYNEDKGEFALRTSVPYPWDSRFLTIADLSSCPFRPWLNDS